MMTDISSSLGCVNHDSMFIQMSQRVSDCTTRHALIFVIADETHTHTDTYIHQAKGINSIYYLIYNVVKKTHDGCDLVFQDKEREKNEMKINYCCLYYCSYVVLFLSSVTKTSEDKRMVTDHCYSASTMEVLNMDENGDE